MRISDFHPTHLIARLRVVPPWKLGAAVCAVSLVGSGLGSGLVWYSTHARQFCLSCHQHQRVAFEEQSKLHPRSVVCADCHGEGHTLLPTRFAADPGVVRVHCQECHSQIVTDQQRDYKYNTMRIRITHASHLKLPQVTCTTCHYNVAHDRREHPTNRPPMEVCLKCHKGEKRACSTCHPRGSLPTPPRPAAGGPETCDECHPDWEAETYLVEGKLFRHGSHLSAELRCKNCHSHARRHGELLVPSPGCWQNCHQKPPASHGKDWRVRHGAEYQAGRQDCNQCHEPQSCSRCHGLEMPHGEDWRGSHARAARQTSLCARCHEQEFCQECHLQSRPASHGGGWREAHGKAYRKREKFCATCHDQRSCGRCHEPAPHGADWAQWGHMEAARQNRKGCTVCHEERSCLACHGTSIPHGKDWSRNHGREAGANPGLCERCHDQADCRTCHERVAPRSHLQQGWRKGHSSLQGEGACGVLCHGPDACRSCHGLAMPHPERWALEHKGQASIAPDSVCFRCHQKEIFCVTCHEQG